jgi:hypothetical protein
MSRTPSLSTALWSAVAAVSLAACAEDTPTFVDAPTPTEYDAPNDASPDASLAVAQIPEMVTGGARCGDLQPEAIAVDITNTGTHTLEIYGAEATGGFTVPTTQITISPGASGTLTVNPPLSVIGTDIGGTTKTGQLTFHTNENGSPMRSVGLQVIVDGAQLSIRDFGGTVLPELAFSSQSGCPSFQNIYIYNTGNESVQLGFPSASGFGFSGFSPSSTVGPGEDVNQVVNVFTIGPCTGTATVSYEVTGTVCNQLPLTINATFTIAGQSSCFCS